jgi:hypothetical protein
MLIFQLPVVQENIKENDKTACITMLRVGIEPAYMKDEASYL